MGQFDNGESLKMDCTIDIDEVSEVATVRVTGPVTVPELALAFERLAAHPQFREDWARLWDFREADLPGLTRADLHRIGHAATTKLSTPGTRVAVLVARDVDFGMARMFQSWEGDTLPASMRVFREAEAAEAWLKSGESDPLPPKRSGT